MKFSSKGIVSFPWPVHIAYWSGIIIIWVLFAWVFLGEVYDPFINKLGYLPSQLIVSYSFIYYLLPNLFIKKYLRFFIGLISVSYVSMVVARIMKIYFTETLTGFESEKESLGQILVELDPLLIQYMIWVFMTPALTVIIVMILNHYYHRERLAQLKNKKLQTELRFLKTQLHPHFLFNTLNNLYTLSLTNSPKTANIAQRLYEILEFVFHQEGQNMVLLKDEVKLLSNYIELEKLRYGKRLLVDVNLDIDDGNYKVIPLLLLSIVENAFKHGASGDLKTPRIEVKLNVINGKLDFSVINTKPVNQTIDNSGYRKGIGIKNIRRQLELIYMKGFTYQIFDNEMNYRVELSLNLTTDITNDNVVLQAMQ